MAFESLPGVKINDVDNERAYIFADFFSVYENTQDPEELPKIYKWSDFVSIAENRDAFLLKTGEIGSNPPVSFNIAKDLIPDPATQIRIRAIIEGAIAANPKTEYVYGRRILPLKTICVSCEIPPEAYIATGGYRESEINNANVILKNSGFDKLIWIFAPFATVLTLVLQLFFFEEILANLLVICVISLFTGFATGLSIYLFCIYGAKTLYGKILKDDPALLEEITFVVCEDGFIACESEVYNFSDIIKWHEVAYFIETTHLFIVFSNNKAVFWLPKRMFPKELHKELGDFIADKLQQK
jgi:hypothetical protein